MNQLGALKQVLADALTGAGLDALPREPARVSPPVALVSPASPYLSAGETFGTRRVRLRVRLVAQAGENADEDLDTALLAAVPAIEDAPAPGSGLGASWTVDEVTEPYLLLANGASYPALDVVATTEITT